ncbi:MAG: HdeD family acid-resistance protein [Oricola sp.]
MAMGNEGSGMVGPSWVWMMILAVISIIGGLFALFNPLAATMATVFLVGWAFLLLGVAQIVHAFSDREWPGFLWALLFGVLTLLVGISLLWNPLAGMVSLTILVAALLLFTGIVKLMFAFALRPLPNWIWVLLSGAVSILLAIMVFANLPWAAATVLGIFLAVELLSNGILFLFVALGLRQA